MSAVLLALLLACGGAPSPTPPPPPPEVAPPPAPPVDEPPDASPVDEADLVVEVLVRGPRDAIVGARVLTDGRVQELRELRDGRGWRTTRRLTAAQRDQVRALLDPAGLARLPALLPAPPGAPPDAPEATWRVRFGDAWQSWRVPAATLRRVSPFAEVEGVLREAAAVEPTVSRWTVFASSSPWTFELACDPRDVALARGLAAHLRDPAWPAAPTEPAAAERLVVTWSRGLTTERTAWLADGRVLRTSSDGVTAAVRLPAAVEARAVDAWKALDPAAPPRCP